MTNRPRSILLFERFFLAATVLSIAADTARFGVTVGLLIGLALSLAVWFLLTRRASSVAKWLVVAFTIFDVGLWIEDGVTNGIGGPALAYFAVQVSATVLGLIATLFLFREDAVRWLSSGGTRGEIDLQVFE